MAIDAASASMFDATAVVKKEDEFSERVNPSRAC